MSYTGSDALQTAIYQRLSADAALSAIVGSDIYDVLPTGTLPSIYVTLGDEDVRDASDSTGAAARVTFLVSVVSRSGGYQTAKQAGQAIVDALLSAPLSLTEGAMVGPWYTKSSAKRTGDPDVRRLDLTFEGLVQDTP